jgi:hypothetical protein
VHLAGIMQHFGDCGITEDLPQALHDAGSTALLPQGLHVHQVGSCLVASCCRTLGLAHMHKPMHPWMGAARDGETSGWAHLTCPYIMLERSEQSCCCLYARHTTNADYHRDMCSTCVLVGKC